MNARRLEELLIAWEENNLTDEERSELKELLATQPEARRRLVEAGVLQSAAKERVQTWETAPSPRLLAPPDALRKVTWLSWRPFTAAAAGLALGFFCASVAWAYVAPRVPSLIEKTVSPVNGDFEGAELPVADGMPQRFGVWSGDSARITESEQGIQPTSGRHMLRILRSDSRLDVSKRTNPGGELMQLIDLRPFAADLASGNAVLELSASANTSVERGEQFRFGVQAYALSGTAADLGADMREVSLAALASSRKGLHLDSDPASWQTGATRLLLPPETDFVMVRVVLTQKDTRPQDHVEFGGHYIDNVQLRLTTQSAKPATRRK
jgi:hypothetical protein